MFEGQRHPQTVRLVFSAALVVTSLFLRGCGGGEEPSPDPPPPSCHAQGACPSDGLGTDRNGFTNNTGWAPDGKACCDICAAPGTKKVNCFDPTTCGHKTGRDDWDFVILDQIWLPQLCRALVEGHDPTVTHQPGTRCTTGARRTSGLSIHGLWPNYVGGYPQCCEHIALPEKLPAAIVAEAAEEWVDPTVKANDDCGFCSMWAHETMKHGTCLAKDMVGYFDTTLGLLRRLRKQTDEVSAVLRLASLGRVQTDDLKGVFAPRTVQFLCDPRDRRSTNDTGVFLELRTCWNRTAAFSPARPSAEDFAPIDCPGKAVGSACPEFIIAATEEDPADELNFE
mmetsp:Transcript_102056/g.288195  ORF Transcript_102056/g.288195 Transcript_102056/m.288195 type:complete len:339 (-) Transcript_102056:125-1141(-)